MSSIQFAATAFSLIYIFFATKNNVICFLFGAIASACWAFESHYNLNLKFDGLLQLFYFFMSFYGAYNWTKTGKPGTGNIRKLDIKFNLLIVVSGVVISFLCAKIALNFFETNFAYLDALTTGFSIIATILLTKRYIENWIFWLFINPAYMFIYYRSGAMLFVGISLIYTLMSIKGYLDWKKEMRLAY